MLSCSAALTHDLLPTRTEHPAVMKLATATVTALALGIALWGSSSVFDLVILPWSTLAVAFGPLLMLLALGRPVSERRAIQMSVTGIAVALLWRQAGWQDMLHEGLPGILAGLLIGILWRTRQAQAQSKAQAVAYSGAAPLELPAPLVVLSGAGAIGVVGSVTGTAGPSGAGVHSVAAGDGLSAGAVATSPSGSRNQAITRTSNTIRMMIQNHRLAGFRPELGSVTIALLLHRHARMPHARCAYRVDVSRVGQPPGSFPRVALCGRTRMRYTEPGNGGIDVSDIQQPGQQGQPTSAGGFDFNHPTIISLLYLASPLLGVTALIGIVLAYVWRNEPHAEWESSHYRYLIRTFWLGLIGSAVSVLFMIVLVGFLLLAAVFVLVVVRCVLSLVNAQKQQPMPNAETWFA